MRDKFSLKLNSKQRKYLIGAVIFIGLLPLLFLGSIYFGAWGPIPSKKELAELKYQRATEIYSSDSVLIGKLFLYDRQPISFDGLPQKVMDALVAIEDERFYQHNGVDFRSLLRVAIKTVLLQDQSAGGGSTISQQLAKNLYPREAGGKIRLVADKFREMIVAGRLEDIYSKEEIILHYFNTVSFGDNTFGIESAALKFFNKQTKDLNLEEAATLVGMLKATYGYNPRIFPDRSLARRNLVLHAMANNGYLDEEVKDSLVELPIELDYREYDHNAGIAPYFREEVRKQMLNWSRAQKEDGQEYNIYTSGLKVYTTLNFRMQQLAEQTMTAHLAPLQKKFEESYGDKAPWLTDQALLLKNARRSLTFKNLTEAGLTEQQALDSMKVKRDMVFAGWEGEKQVQASPMDSISHYMKFLNLGSLSIDPHDGAVKTWIGGVNFKYYKYDHISQSKRQVGSTFKPIVYTAALEKGIEPCDYFSAREVAYENLEGWSPANSGDKDEAYLNYSMEEALSHSVNTVAVKVLEETGISNVISQARKMGIASDLPSLPSLALGTGSIGIDEMAGAFASYANGGRYVSPYIIERITDNRDSLLARMEPKISETPAFSEITRQTMLELMKSVVNNGTASRIRSTYGLNNDIAGKTGTTQNNKDAWFMAVTPRLVHVSWVGLENHEIGFRNTAMGQGANAALPLFALLMKELNKDSNFNDITRARFESPLAVVADRLDCKPVKRDGFFKRLFTNPDKKKKRKFRDEDTGK